MRTVSGSLTVSVGVRQSDLELTGPEVALLGQSSQRPDRLSDRRVRTSLRVVSDPRVYGECPNVEGVRVRRDRTGPLDTLL